MRKTRYRKYYILEIMIIALIFVGLYPTLKVRQANMDDIKTSIEKTANLEKMKIGDEKIIKKLYYINSNDIEDFISYVPNSNMEAEEVLVLKLKDEKKVSEIKAKIQKRIDKQSDSFRSYRPEKYETIKNYVLYNEGEYIIFIISDEVSAIKDAIKKDFK